MNGKLTVELRNLNPGFSLAVPSEPVAEKRQ